MFNSTFNNTTFYLQVIFCHFLRRDLPTILTIQLLIINLTTFTFTLSSSGLIKCPDVLANQPRFHQWFAYISCSDDVIISECKKTFNNYLLNFYQNFVNNSTMEILLVVHNEAIFSFQMKSSVEILNENLLQICIFFLLVFSWKDRSG